VNDLEKEGNRFLFLKYYSKKSKKLIIFSIEICIQEDFAGLLNFFLS